MGGISLSIHPLFYLFGLYYALTGRVFMFIIYTVCAVVHELGHSFVANALGYRLKKITLMPFGAVISGDTQNLRPADQFKIALAGPFLNLGVGLLFVAFWWIYPELYTYTDVVVEANMSLALINFLPIFPLDGGRVLFSILAIKLKNSTASKICKGIGLVFSLLLLALFVASCFFSVNISLLFFSLFVFAGVFDKNKDNSYIRVYSVLSPERLKRGIEYKKQGIAKSASVKKLVSILSSDAINEVVVYDNDKPIAVLGQDKINKILEKGDLYAPIYKYISV